MEAGVAREDLEPKGSNSMFLARLAPMQDTEAMSNLSNEQIAWWGALCVASVLFLGSAAVLLMGADSPGPIFSRTAMAIFIVLAIAKLRRIAKKEH